MPIDSFVCALDKATHDVKKTPDLLFFLFTFIARKCLKRFFLVLLSLTCRHIAG